MAVINPQEKKLAKRTSVQWSNLSYSVSRTTDTQRRHKSKISEKSGRCGRQNATPVPPALPGMYAALFTGGVSKGQ